MIERVIEVAANYYKVSVTALNSSSRARTVSFPRQVAMYLARTETDASFPQIGAHLGNRDHTTVLYGYEKISAKMDTDASIRRDIMEIKSALYNAPA